MHQVQTVISPLSLGNIGESLAEGFDIVSADCIQFSQEISSSGIFSLILAQKSKTMLDLLKYYLIRSYTRLNLNVGTKAPLRLTNPPLEPY